MKNEIDAAKPLARSACAVANSLDILGDKWSLLVVRDLLPGKRTYGELARSREHIPTNILADRLKRLEGAGIITSTPYQERPVRYDYTLTPKGRALGDVLLAFVRWGKAHIPGTVAMHQGPTRVETPAPETKSRGTGPKRTASPARTDGRQPRRTVPVTEEASRGFPKARGGGRHASTRGKP